MLFNMYLSLCSEVPSAASFHPLAPGTRRSILGPAGGDFFLVEVVGDRKGDQEGGTRKRLLLAGPVDSGERGLGLLE